MYFFHGNAYLIKNLGDEAFVLAVPVWQHSWCLNSIQTRTISGVHEVLGSISVLVGMGYT
jgi:hypothetical protein